MRTLFLTVVVSVYASAWGQTQIDLYRQVKATTKPVKVGAVLPAACTPGDLFLKSDAPAGAALYVCLSANLWSLQSGASGGGGSITVQSDGTWVGSVPTHNYLSGNGVLKALSNNGTRIDIVNLIDTAVVQTHDNEQSGRDVLCASASASSSNYSCLVTPPISVLTRGMTLHWIPDLASAGGATTLQVDAMNPVAVKLDDGVSDPSSGDIAAGRMLPIWYDGTVFRMISSIAVSAEIARPACTTGVRGRLWFTQGLAGVKDELSLCGRDSAGQYAWRVIY